MKDGTVAFDSDVPSPPVNPARRQGWRARLHLVFKGLVLVGTLVGLGIILNQTPLGDLLGTDWIDREVRGHGLQGEGLFLLLGSAALALGLPRQGVSFLAGYAFGFLVGTGVALLASVIGCAACFTYSRWIGREVIARRFPGRVKRLDGFLKDNPFSMTLLVRLLPVGSNLLTNLAAGVSSVGILPFLGGSAVGYLPQTAIFALLGSGMRLDPAWRVTSSVILFLAATALGLYLYRRYRHGRRLADDPELDMLAGEEPETPRSP